MKAILLASALVAGTATLAIAQTAVSSYGAAHPRIHEVNGRLHEQNRRIDRSLALGKISAQQAAALHAQDASIKSEEQTDKSLDNGHITKADKLALNQQLNTVSKQFGVVGHPRLHHVNTRLRAQTARIDRAETAGKLTADQAAQFHAEDAALKSQEVTEKSLDDGHITRADERSLSQEVSSIGHQIGNATGATGATGAHAGSHGGSHK